MFWGVIFFVFFVLDTTPNVFTEDPAVRFAKSLGFYEDVEWSLSRASIGVSYYSLAYICLKRIEISYRDEVCFITITIPT